MILFIMMTLSMQCENNGSVSVGSTNKNYTLEYKYALIKQ